MLSIFRTSFLKVCLILYGFCVAMISVMLVLTSSSISCVTTKVPQAPPSFPPEVCTCHFPFPSWHLLRWLSIRYGSIHSFFSFWTAPGSPWPAFQHTSGYAFEHPMTKSMTGIFILPAWPIPQPKSMKRGGKSLWKAGNWSFVVFLRTVVWIIAGPFSSCLNFVILILSKINSTPIFRMKLCSCPKIILNHEKLSCFAFALASPNINIK